MHMQCLQGGEVIKKNKVKKNAENYKFDRQKNAWMKPPLEIENEGREIWQQHQDKNSIREMPSFYLRIWLE